MESALTWEEMAAIPETYFTAWGSLFQCLKLTQKDKLLVRGATCALGYVAVQLAKALGCTMVGTTHREYKMELLKEAGCDECLLDDGSLRDKVPGVTKALELIGIKTVKDTMMSVEQGGIVCNTGVLGKVYEWNHFDPIKDIPNGVFLTGFYSNYPTTGMMQEMPALPGCVSAVGSAFFFMSRTICIKRFCIVFVSAVTGGGLSCCIS